MTSVRDILRSADKAIYEFRVRVGTPPTHLRINPRAARRILLDQGIDDGSQLLTLFGCRVIEDAAIPAHEVRAERVEYAVPAPTSEATLYIGDVKVGTVKKWRIDRQAP